MNQNTDSYFLLPGAIKCSRSPIEITTLLGSCVAVCLWDKNLKIGGINHYMMPFWNGTGLASPKYGNIAIEKLINQMINLGSNPSNLVAKVFGGASGLTTNNSPFNIGERNIDIQKHILKQFEINVIASSTGGNIGRKIIFNTETGVVRMKYIKSKK